METMTQEDKELLLKDLCARLDTNLVCSIYRTDDYCVGYRDEILHGYCKGDIWYEFYFGEDCGICIDNVSKIKPYLFPMSSMTDEQKEEYYHIVNYISPDDTETWMEGEFIYVDTTQFLRLINFYHRNHLDYRGLINGGLALDATGKNIY